MKESSQKESAHLHLQALESSASAVLITDANRDDNPIIFSNPAFERLTGYCHDEILGRNCQFLQRDDTNQEALNKIQAATKRGEHCQVVLRNYRKDGSLFWNQLTITPIHGTNGRVTHFVSMLNDVSAQVQSKELGEAKQALKETQEELESQAEIHANKSASDGRHNKELARAHMYYLDNMQKMVLAIGKSPDPDQWLDNCLDVILEIFQADRAWLLYPCDPYTTNYSTPVEVTVADYPTAFSSGKKLAMNEDIKQLLHHALKAKGPSIQQQVEAKFLVDACSVQSQMFMMIKPHIGKPWVLGLHQCSRERQWTTEEQHLFNDIGIRIGELLNSVHLYEELKEREERLRLLLESTNEGIYGIDINGICTFANPAAAQQLGYGNADELIGRDMIKLTGFNCFGAQSLDSAPCRVCQVHQEGKGINWEGGGFQQADGNFFPVEFHCKPVRREEHIDGATVTFVNITERKQFEDKIWHQANYDGLTSLPNRTLFMDRLSQATHSALREGHSVALMFIDLDRFKWVNDTLGHKAGDQLLVEAARRLTACARKSDTVARLGGDEFCVILSFINELRSVEQVAEKILQNLAQPYQLSNLNESFISGTIGIAFYPDDAADATSLLQNADMAMYKAKEDGRNTYAYFTEEMHQMALEHTRVELELHHALENNELELYYQPLIDLRSGAIVGAEALLRWNHPERGLVYPAEFIPLADETGLILSIGDWVLHNVVKQLSDWREQGLPSLKTSINLSARQCADAGLIKRLNDVLEESRFPASNLGLTMEITENQMMEHIDEVLERLQQIRDMGISLTVDNFGTGYTSLIELKRFPIEAIKIAGAFVQNITDNPKDAGLTCAIISMSHNLKLKVIAEGVETIDQLEFLQQAGCDLGHGHYFSRALPAKAFEVYLQKSLRQLQQR